MSTGNLSSGEEDLEIIEEPEAEEEVEEPNDENQDPPTGDAPADDSNNKEAKVKKVRNPQPKLDAERLRGPRGLLALEEMFSKVKFKGPKHEEEDLNLLMKTYEYWCHRLFPKFPFDNCLERLEKLGSTKAVHNYLRMVRLNITDDLPVIDSDDSDNDGGNTNDVITLDTNTIDPSTNNDFDRLLPSCALQPTFSHDTTSGDLTDEQLERIRLNREKAQQRRKEMQICNSQLSQEVNDPSNTILQNTSDSEQDTQQTVMNSIIGTNGLKDVENIYVAVDSPTSPDLEHTSCSSPQLNSQADMFMNNIMSQDHLSLDGDQASQSDLMVISDSQKSNLSSTGFSTASVVKNGSDKMSVAYDTSQSQEPENLQRLTEEIIVSEVDSPINVDIRLVAVDSSSQESEHKTISSIESEYPRIISEVDDLVISNSQNSNLTDFSMTTAFQNDTDKMSVAYDTTQSQESENLERLTEEMIVSEVDSPMEVDSPTL